MLRKELPMYLLWRTSDHSASASAQQFFRSAAKEFLQPSVEDGQHDRTGQHKSLCIVDEAMWYSEERSSIICTMVTAAEK